MVSSTLDISFKAFIKQQRNLWNQSDIAELCASLDSDCIIKGLDRTGKKILHLCPALMINCFVLSQTTQLLWSKLFLCPHLSLQSSSEWTFSSLSAHFSTSVSRCVLKRREGCLCWHEPDLSPSCLYCFKDPGHCVMCTEERHSTQYVLVGKTGRKREFLQK